MEKCLNEVIECQFENKTEKLKTTVTWPFALSTSSHPACTMLVSVAAALLLLASSLQEAEAKPQNNYNQYYSEYNNQDYSENYAGNYDQQVNVKKK